MEQTRLDCLKTMLTGESLLFGLIGRALYREPDSSWLDELITEGVFDEAPFGEDLPEIQQGLEMLQLWSEKNRKGVSPADFKRLKEEHLRLFVGIDKIPAPPWESVYFSEKRLTFQQQTFQVREWYNRFGLQLERIDQEPDDHIGLEMVFVAQLAILAVKAASEGKQETVAEFIQAQRDFLTDHLLLWGPVWAKVVKKEAVTEFYCGLAHLTHGALLAAAALVEVDLPKEVHFASA